MNYEKYGTTTSEGLYLVVRQVELDLIKIQQKHIETVRKQLTPDTHQVPAPNVDERTKTRMIQVY